MRTIWQGTVYDNSPGATYDTYMDQAVVSAGSLSIF